MFINEDALVKWLQRHSTGGARGLRLGIGDDAALVEPCRGCELILTTDLSIENVHFLRRKHPARAVGHRALARSLSDIAAMGGTPRYALVSLAISRRTAQAWLNDFYAGLFALAHRYKVAVVGGDTAILNGATTVDVMVAGEVAKGKAVLRSRARPGDQLFVSGRLGMSAIGLRLARKGANPRRAANGVPEAALKAHLYPEPRCELGRFLSDRKLATAMIDLSDGLSTDLARLCSSSRVGARVEAAKIPAPSPASFAGLSSSDALGLALNGGEDYELLFTVPLRKISQLPRQFRGVPLQHIGEITRSKEKLLVLPGGAPVTLRTGGYDHFRKIG